jgi:hypothetical protein
MEKDELYNFAQETKIFCKKLIDNGMIDDNFKPYGGIPQNAKVNSYSSKMMGLNDSENWFNYIQNPKLTNNELLEKVSNIEDSTYRAYTISRIIKTRVAYSDEWYLDLLGCKHNPILKDSSWDNLICGVEFDIKSTYPTHKESDIFHNVDNIIEKPIEYISRMYAGSSSKNWKNPSERGHAGQLNNRLFIINNSLVSPKNKFLVECGNKERFKMLEYLAKNFSEDNIINVNVLNNNDNRYYDVKCGIVIISQITDKEVVYNLLKKN